MSQFPSHRHSGSSMMELGSCCVYTCIHSILSCTFRLLGHHASICVIGGTRIETCIHLSKYIAMPLSCSLSQQNQESAIFRDSARISRITAKQRLIGAFRWISAQDSPDMHHPSEARRSLACTPVSFTFLVNSLIN